MMVVMASTSDPPGTIDGVPTTTRTGTEAGGDLVAIAVNGRAFHAALDPRATGARADGIPDPVLRRRGRGVQAHYQVSPACAAVIRRRLRDIADSWLYDGDPDELGERQACLRGVRQVDRALAAVGPGAPPSQTPLHATAPPADGGAPLYQRPTATP
jgi:hypothetical protein